MRTTFDANSTSVLVHICYDKSDLEGMQADELRSAWLTGYPGVFNKEALGAMGTEELAKALWDWVLQIRI